MIGKVIAHLLKANADLLVIVPAGNIYPYVMNEDTHLPAIIYTIDSVTPGYDKDGWLGDECVFSVVTFCDNYTTLQCIALEIRQALELQSGTHEGITLRNIYLTGQLEGFNIQEDVFLNKQTFSTEII
jgi:hypothetical protein